MMTLTKRLSPGQTLTFLLDDKSNTQRCNEILNHGVAWVKGAILVLQRAIEYSTKALIEPARVAENYWLLLELCFGLRKGNGKAGNYSNEVNEILAVLSKTFSGLSHDLTIADISQMPFFTKLQLQCMHPLGNPQDHFAGLVVVSAGETVGSIVDGIRSYLGSSAPARVKQTELASPIHLHFDRLIAGKGRHAVVTLVHEGTHKFAATTDGQYFPDGRTPGMEMAQIITILQSTQIADYDSFAALLADARKRMSEIGPMGKAITNLKNMPSDKAMKNADSYANFALDVHDLPTAEETRAVIRAVMNPHN